MLIELDVADETVAIVKGLAELTRPGHKQPLALFIQDALRTYAWLLRQQVNGRSIVSLSADTMGYLSGSADVPESSAPVLVSLIPDGSIDQVRELLV